jgi:hypothetical protein
MGQYRQAIQKLQALISLKLLQKYFLNSSKVLIEIQLYFNLIKSKNSNNLMRIANDVVVIKGFMGAIRGVKT